uniref:Uncharacterized protein n=1 Tax=Glossina pallidipes TaxID=7398 RepID=A0A1A9Z2F9_GLOPL
MHLGFSSNSLHIPAYITLRQYVLFRGQVTALASTTKVSALTILSLIADCNVCGKINSLPMDLGYEIFNVARITVSGKRNIPSTLTTAIDLPQVQAHIHIIHICECSFSFSVDWFVRSLEVLLCDIDEDYKKIRWKRLLTKLLAGIVWKLGSPKTIIERLLLENDI